MCQSGAARMNRWRFVGTHQRAQLKRDKPIKLWELPRLEKSHEGEYNCRMSPSTNLGASGCSTLK